MNGSKYCPTCRRSSYPARVCHAAGRVSSSFFSRPKSRAKSFAKKFIPLKKFPSNIRWRKL